MLNSIGLVRLGFPWNRELDRCLLESDGSVRFLTVWAVPIFLHTPTSQ